jgi:hypothetical protein
MFRMFDRHKQRPNRFESDASALYAGEWFEISEELCNYMLDLLPPLWIRGEMFAMREFLTESVTSVFFTLKIDGRIRGACMQPARRRPSWPICCWANSTASRPSIKRGARTSDRFPNGAIVSYPYLWRWQADEGASMARRTCLALTVPDPRQNITHLVILPISGTPQHADQTALEIPTSNCGGRAFGVQARLDHRQRV